MGAVISSVALEGWTILTAAARDALKQVLINSLLVVGEHTVAFLVEGIRTLRRLMFHDENAIAMDAGSNWRALAERFVADLIDVSWQ